MENTFLQLALSRCETYVTGAGEEKQNTFEQIAGNISQAQS